MTQKPEIGDDGEFVEAVDVQKASKFDYRFVLLCTAILLGVLIALFNFIEFWFDGFALPITQPIISVFTIVIWVYLFASISYDMKRVQTLRWRIIRIALYGGFFCIAIYIASFTPIPFPYRDEPMETLIFETWVLSTYSVIFSIPVAYVRYVQLPPDKQKQKAK